MSSNLTKDVITGQGRRHTNGEPRRQDDRDLVEVLNQHTRFEQLVARLSATFINLTADKVEAAIDDALREISEFLESDFSTFIVTDPETSDMRHSHQWVKPQVDVAIDFINFDISQGAPWIAKNLKQGNPIVINRETDLPEHATFEHEIMQNLGIKSVLFVPFHVEGKVAGYIVVNRLARETKWPRELIPSLKLMGEILGNAVQRQIADEKLQTALTEIGQLKEQLQTENGLLKQEIEILSPHAEIVGDSPALKSAISQAEQVAPLDSIVLILGETGSGKELIADLVHRESSRAQKKMVRVNCASLPASLIESELFGREKGAYTGALSKQIGRFELADGSTLFLDEIGELSLELQSKLLRVLQEGEFERLGSNRTIQVDARVVAATNRDLATLVAEGKFREDLYYRLNVFPIVVPPLRERRTDIPALVWSFVREYSETMGKSIDRISKSTMQRLQAYDWPGNVRELRNVIERSMILSRAGTLCVNLGEVESSQPANQTLVEVDRRHIHSVLEQTGWRVRGAGGAAQILGLNPSTLESRMKKLDIKRTPE